MGSYVGWLVSNDKARAESQAWGALEELYSILHSVEDWQNDPALVRALAQDGQALVIRALDALHGHALGAHGQVSRGLALPHYK